MKSTLFSILIVILIFSCDSSKIIIPQKNKSSETTSKPKNIIFMIGDGMGISQITAGLFSNHNKLHLEEFKVIGLHKTYSSDNLITDSAAGATAFACGEKTYNGAISVNNEKHSMKTILEFAEDKGLKTGLVATSTIVHATPACYYAHVEERHMYEKIALEILDSGVDFFAGGGLDYFNKRTDGRNLIRELENKGYMIQDSSNFSNLNEINPFPHAQYGILTAKGDPSKQLDGRNYLPMISQKAVNFLNQKDKKNKGFFVMIEGSQIDWGGHANDADYIITEMLDFDKTIGKILDFAKKDGETLVIVTADHETGGFAINPKSKMGDLVTAFTTGHHTADLIPVFAFGPGAEAFGGIYENTALFDKMMNALDLKVENID